MVGDPGKDRVEWVGFSGGNGGFVGRIEEKEGRSHAENLRGYR